MTTFQSPWVLAPFDGYEQLHHPEKIIITNHTPTRTQWTEGTTTCNPTVQVWLTTPGTLLEKTTPRCLRCCTLTNTPTGHGQPDINSR